MKMVDLEGRLLEAKSDMSEFTVLLENDIKYVRRVRLVPDAYTCYDNEWVLLKIKDVTIVVDWSKDEPRAGLKVTFTSKQMQSIVTMQRTHGLELRPTIRFLLDDVGVHENVVEVMV